ncbi:ABC transporter permease subunit [Frankia sp. CcI49]|uniref:ABC transporter permease subunit n=1 Tax=Frankia sp. CcI49 TaxID=1745382 RepID=UPI000A068400|nr:ABC transporter permease subunit [Frankia sp. CcI49]
MTSATVSGGRSRHATPASPVDGIAFARLLRVEWAKTVNTRSARWLIAASALLAVAATAIPLGFPDDIDQTQASYLSFPALASALLLPVTSVLALTTEWTQRTVLVTYTLEPRRGRVLRAKIAAGLLLGLFAGLFALLVGFASIALAEGIGRDVANPDGTGPLLGLIPFVLLNMLSGMAFGAVLHNTAAAVVLLYVLPTVWNIIAVGALAEIGEWLDPTQSMAWLLDGTLGDNAARFVTSMLIWIALPLGLGLLRTARREVS